jgi:hypothetical protein
MHFHNYSLGYNKHCLVCMIVSTLFMTVDRIITVLVWYMYELYTDLHIFGFDHHSTGLSWS